MCYASHLVTIFLWAWLSSCVFLGPSGSIASAKGYMAEGGEGCSVIRCLFNFSNSTRCHSHLYLLMPPFFPPLRRARLTHYWAERKQWKKWSARCESSVHAPILTIHYWCCIFVIRTSLLHYVYQVHGEYHRLPTLISMRTVQPLLEPPVRGEYWRHLCHKFLFPLKHRFLIGPISISQWHYGAL